MTFDIKKFRSANFSAREKEVPVPQLEQFFNGDSKRVWVVRSLTGEELFAVRQAGEKSRNIEAVIEKLVSGDTREKIKGALEAIGISQDLPEDYVRRLEMLCRGSVRPGIEKKDAVRMAESYPMVFTNLTDEIMILTGMGKKLGELKSSGTTRKSKTA